MASLLLLLIMGGLVFWGLWYLFVRSVVWVFEPVIQYFQRGEETGDSIENDVPKEKPRKAIFTISSIQKDGTYKVDEMEFDLPKEKGGPKYN